MLITLTVASLTAGCGGSDSDSPQTTPITATATTTRTAETTHPRTRCAQPSGQQKAALRVSLKPPATPRARPWALTRAHGRSYMAAVLAKPAGLRLVVLVDFPNSGGYLSAMRAVNGIAHTWTTLPHAGSRIPAAGERALRCVGVGT